MEKVTEQEMHHALFGRPAGGVSRSNVIPLIRRKEADAPVIPKGLVVRLSVRDPVWGGFPQLYVFQSSTISSVQALCDAQKQARKDGWRIHCVLSIDNEV